MKNRIFITALLSSVMIVLFLAPICACETYSINNDSIKIYETALEEEKIDSAIKNMQSNMEAVDLIKDKKEWFIAYKLVINRYSDILDPPESIYDYFTEQELELLFCVVEAEATEGTFIEKANVASVIFNRIQNDKFKNTINEVLINNQFSCISDGRYKKVNITNDTILACEYAFMIEDTTNGALFFEGRKSNTHSNYAEYIFTDNIGHKFYK